VYFQMHLYRLSSRFVCFYSRIGECILISSYAHPSPLFVIIIIISQAPSFLPTESEKIDDDKRFEVSETIGGETAQGNKTTYGLTRMAPKDDEAKARYENKKKEQDKNRTSRSSERV